MSVIIKVQYLLLRTSQLLIFGAIPESLELHAERMQEVARVDDHSAVALEAHPEIRI